MSDKTKSNPIWLERVGFYMAKTDASSMLQWPCKIAERVITTVGNGNGLVFVGSFVILSYALL